MPTQMSLFGFTHHQQQKVVCTTTQNKTSRSPMLTCLHTYSRVIVSRIKSSFINKADIRQCVRCHDVYMCVCKTYVTALVTVSLKATFGFPITHGQLYSLSILYNTTSKQHHHVSDFCQSLLSTLLSVLHKQHFTSHRSVLTKIEYEKISTSLML